MALPALVVVLAVAISYARGGRLGRIAEADLHGNPLLFAGLLLQIGVNAGASRGAFEDATGYLLLLLSQLLVLAWVWLNRHRPGMILVLLGLLLNALVIGANGAMPVDLDAVRRLGFENPQIPGGKHVVMTDETLLPWLGDIFPIALIRTVISVGDVVLSAGLVPLTHHLMTHTPASKRRGGPHNVEIPPVMVTREARDQAEASGSPGVRRGWG